jgi:hypothetical protein
MSTTTAQKTCWADYGECKTDLGIIVDIGLNIKASNHRFGILRKEFCGDNRRKKEIT